MVQVAMKVLQVNASRIKLESTNTTRVSNTSPSAASSTADLNGKALEIACNELLTRLKSTAAKHLKSSEVEIELIDEVVYKSGTATQLKWDELINLAFLDRVCLTENGHYATPIIHFDKKIEKGHPFAYYVHGAAIITTTVDCLRGTYSFDYVKLVHDFGKSMNDAVDNGQVEGGLIQGIGWMTLEELLYDQKGKLMTNALSTYKIPDIYSVPKEVSILALKTEGHPLAIRRSKAVGEPPLMYGIGAYFAIQNAIRSFNTAYRCSFDAPFTPEKVLMALYEQNPESTAGVNHSHVKAKIA